MDPVAKRFMWDLIMQISHGSGSGSAAAAEAAQKTTIVLTTHSMEECSALCDRMCIMVDGRLRCLGSEQHLKHRYGRNLQAQIKLREPSAEQDLAPLLAKLAAAVAAAPALARSRQSSARTRSTNSPSNSEGLYPMDAVTLLPSPEEHHKVRVATSQIELACEALGKPRRAALFRAAFAEQARSSASGAAARTSPCCNARAVRRRGRDTSGSMVHDAAEGEAGKGSSGVGSNPSWLVAEEFSRTGWVNASTFARWWLLLDWSEALDHFLATSFNGGAAAASAPSDNEVHRIEQHDATLRFVIPKPTRRPDCSGCGIGLGSVFGRLERAKAELNIAEYSVSQTSLDQIFVDFARTQAEAMTVHT
jgi:hypothetical protein